MRVNGIYITNQNFISLDIIYFFVCYFFTVYICYLILFCNFISIIKFYTYIFFYSITYNLKFLIISIFTFSRNSRKNTFTIRVCKVCLINYYSYIRCNLPISVNNSSTYWSFFIISSS